MKICIVTGGSGGHIFPALTYADYAKSLGNEVIFIGNDHRMESKIIPEEGYSFFGIHNEGLQGSSLDKIKAVFGQFKAIEMAKKHLRTIKPEVVIAFGGYVSLPVVLAASNLNIPIVLHEQNALPGKANKMAAKKANAIITCYEEAFQDLPNVHLLGNPRASLDKNKDINENILEDLQIPKNKPVVLAIMGSQGSTAMNEKFLELIKTFSNEDIQLILTVGPDNYEEFLSKVGSVPPNIHIKSFVDAKSLMVKSDLLIARSGASTIAEVEAFGVPTLFIPSPYVANNHQHYNAMSLFNKDACGILEEKDIKEDILSKQIIKLIKDDNIRNTWSKNASKLAKTNAVSDIHNLVVEVVTYA